MSWLSKRLEELQAQANIFDGGKTASTVRNTRKAPPAQTVRKAPAQSFTNKVRDVFDANTQADQYRRAQKTVAPFRIPTSYEDQQKMAGNARPFTNLGQQLVGNTARFANTAAAGVNEVIDTGRMYTAQATKNPVAFKNVVDQMKARQSEQYKPNSGLLGAGTIFNSPEEYGRLGASETAKRVGFNTLGTASEVVPMAKVARPVTAGGKVVGNSLVAGSKTLPTTSLVGRTVNTANIANSSSKLVPRLAYNAGEGAVTGGAESVARQYAQTGQIDPLAVLADTAANTVLSTGMSGATALVPRAVQGVKNVDNTAKRTVQSKTPEVRNDPQWQKIDQRITVAVTEASKPNTPPKLKQNYMQEARELMRLRNARANELTGGAKGGFISLEPTSFRPGKSTAPVNAIEGGRFEVNETLPKPLQELGNIARQSKDYSEFESKVLNEYSGFEDMGIVKESNPKAETTPSQFIKEFQDFNEYTSGKPVKNVPFKDLQDFYTQVNDPTYRYNPNQQSLLDSRPSNIDPLESLKQEARKYKSAEEFVKAQGEPLYHGSPNHKIIRKEGFKSNPNGNNLLGEGVYMTRHLAKAENYSLPSDLPRGTTITPEMRSAGVVEGYIPKGSKIYQPETRAELKNISTKELQQQGFDGIEINGETVIFDQSKIKTREQLTDLYNQATQPPESTPVQKVDPLESLKQEARKYKSAEEFVKAQGDAKQVEKAIATIKNTPQIGNRPSPELIKAYETLAKNNHIDSSIISVENRQLVPKRAWDSATTRIGNLERIYNESATQSQPPKSPLTVEKNTKVASDYGDISEVRAVANIMQDYETVSPAVKEQLRNAKDSEVLGILRKANIPANTYGHLIFDLKDSRKAVADLTAGKPNAPAIAYALKSGALPKKPTLQDALEGKSTKIQPTTTQLDTQAQSKIASQPLNQLEQSSNGLKQMQSEKVLQKTPELKVDNSLDPIIQSNANKLKVEGKTTTKSIPVFKVEQTGQRVSKTNVATGKSRNFIENEAGELVEDSKGAYKVFTDDEGAITEVRIGDEVYSSKDIGDLTNIRNYGSTMATQRRNIERAFKDNPKTGNRVNNLVVDYQQAQATKMIGRHAEFNAGMKSVAKDLGISFGIGRGRAKKVSAAIQDFGEGKRTKESLQQEYGAEYANKIVNADKWFRGQYDTLLDEMNSTLTKYGYDPVPKRKDYYTHFQDENLFKKFGLKMQEINDAVGGPMQEASPTGVRGGIPNELAGQSEYLTPNKRFNQFSLQRKGDQRTADAFQAFEKYLSPTLNNIYMTPAIVRARVMSKAIAMENDRLGKDVNQVVVQMREWANSLAGKSNRIGDRQAADTTGARQLLQASNWIQGKVGRNSIVGNVSTAVIQPIVLAQTAGKAGFKNTALALMQEASTTHSKNAPIRQSSFLKRRYSDVSPITKGKIQRSADIASTPLKVIEETAGRVTWQAFYNDALSKGIKGQDAIKYADINAEKTMAGRSIGEKPELYRSKSAGFATQFQLEVNNYIQQVGKEMTPAQVAKTFVAAYGINLLIQEATGRSVGFNPIEAGVDSLEILNSDDDEKIKKVAQRWGGEVVGNVPVVSSILDTMMSDDQVKKVFGTQTPVGRFGVGSPYSSFYDNTVGKVVDGKPEEAGAYLAMPFGYSQAQKTVKGVKAVMDGQLTDKNGETTVEVPQTAGNLVRGALFGPSAIKEVNQYYGNIGVKKEDQKPVQNQTYSKAFDMGKTEYTKEQKKVDAEKAEFKGSETLKGRPKEYQPANSGSIKELSDGTFYTKVGDKYETYDSKSEAEKAIARDKFKKSSDKTMITGDTYFYKTKSGEIKSKPKVEYEYDNKATKRAMDMDNAYDSNDLNGWIKLAEEEVTALESLKSQYDTETESDKIDAIVKKQEAILEKAQSYIDKGYTKKGSSGGSKSSKAKKGKYDYKFAMAGLNPGTVNNSLWSILQDATIKT